MGYVEGIVILVIKDKGNKITNKGLMLVIKRSR